MRPRRVSLCLAASCLVLAALPIPAETYWTVNNSQVTAFALDFQTGASHLAMQGLGDSNRRFSYAAAATDPVTGILWALYIDQFQGRYFLGRLPVGAALPEQVYAFPEAGPWPGSFLEFSPAGVPYLELLEPVDPSSYRTHLATIDLASGQLATLVTFAPEESFSGLAFHPLDGKLYLSGRENCPVPCNFFLDTLTLPGLQRSRIWQSPNYQIGDPLFAASGEMLIQAPSFFRLEGDTLQWFSDPPTFASPFGNQFLWAYASSPAAGTAGCVPTFTRGCLRSRRFAIDVTYDATIFGGGTGAATPQMESDESLKFSFFQPQNLELLLKIIDGCSHNGHYWVYFSGLTNVGVSLRITDMITGAVFAADNPPGTALAPVIDIQALACTL